MEKIILEELVRLNNCYGKLNEEINVMKKENITEELKVNNQREWGSRMNNIRNRVNETILKEYIYI